MGQTKAVEAYLLVTKGTCEEEMFSLAQSKEEKMCSLTNARSRLLPSVPREAGAVSSRTAQAPDLPLAGRSPGSAPPLAGGPNALGNRAIIHRERSSHLSAEEGRNEAPFSPWKSGGDAGNDPRDAQGILLGNLGMEVDGQDVATSEGSRKVGDREQTLVDGCQNAGAEPRELEHRTEPERRSESDETDIRIESLGKPFNMGDDELHKEGEGESRQMFAAATG